MLSMLRKILLVVGILSLAVVSSGCTHGGVGLYGEYDDSYYDDDYDNTDADVALYGGLAVGVGALALYHDYPYHRYHDRYYDEPPPHGRPRPDMRRPDHYRHRGGPPPHGRPGMKGPDHDRRPGHRVHGERPVPGRGKNQHMARPARGQEMNRPARPVGGERPQAHRPSGKGGKRSEVKRPAEYAPKGPGLSAPSGRSGPSMSRPSGSYRSSPSMSRPSGRSGGGRSAAPSHRRGR